MTVRAKFIVSDIRKSQNTGHYVRDPETGERKWAQESTEVATIRMTPVYGGSPENEDFFDATPGGTIELSVVNADAVPEFGEPGQEIYVDFTKAPKAG